jgi:hypothetical protein
VGQAARRVRARGAGGFNRWCGFRCWADRGCLFACCFVMPAAAATAAAAVVNTQCVGHSSLWALLLCHAGAQRDGVPQLKWDPLRLAGAWMCCQCTAAAMQPLTSQAASSRDESGCALAVTELAAAAVSTAAETSLVVP